MSSPFFGKRSRKEEELQILLFSSSFPHHDPIVAAAAAAAAAAESVEGGSVSVVRSPEVLEEREEGERRNFGIQRDNKGKTRARVQYKGGNEREGIHPPPLHKMTTRMAASKGRGGGRRDGSLIFLNPLCQTLESSLRILSRDDLLG